MKLLLLLCFGGYVNFTINGYRILGIIHTDSKSHFQFAATILKKLARRGHEVVVISPISTNITIKNYNSVFIPGIRTKDFVSSFMDIPNKNILDLFNGIKDLMQTIIKIILSDPGVRALLESATKYDAVLMDVVFNDALLGIAHKLNAPVIGLSAKNAHTQITDMVGALSPPSHVPFSLSSFSDRMTFWQRLRNLLLYTFERIYFDFVCYPSQEALYEKYFEDPKPTLHQLRRNVSLVLVNTHFTVSYPRPSVPNMIEVGGLHINTKPNPLPDHLKKYLDDAKDGVIYFSMGTFVESKLLSQNKLESFIETFTTMKQKVLWKFEEKNLTGKSDNVLISDWFPQNDILAHPNVKLFITHGGRLSTLEAIYHGVPMVGIPVFTDQFLNMAAISQAKIGVTLQYNEITKDNLEQTVNEVLNNEKYKMNMEEVSRTFRDQPMSPLDTAVYWVEYVARHKGAPHLHSAGQELSFIQYHNIDAIVLLTVFILIILYLIITLIKNFLRLLCLGRNYKEKREMKQKIN